MFSSPLGMRCAYRGSGEGKDQGCLQEGFVLTVEGLNLGGGMDQVGRGIFGVKVSVRSAQAHRSTGGVGCFEKPSRGEVPIVRCMLLTHRSQRERGLGKKVERAVRGKLGV